MNQQNLAGFIWSVADPLKPSERTVYEMRRTDRFPGVSKIGGSGELIERSSSCG